MIEEEHDKLCALMLQHVPTLKEAAIALMGKTVHVLVVAFPLTEAKEAEFFSVVNSFGGAPSGLLEVASHLAELATLGVQFVSANPKELN